MTEPRRVKAANLEEMLENPGPNLGAALKVYQAEHGHPFPAYKYPEEQAKCLACSALTGHLRRAQQKEDFIVPF